MDKKSVVKEYNQYIRVPTNVFISPKITEITGITREMCDSKGVDIVDALTEFYNDYNDNMYIVAHNIDFDKTLIEIELHRNLSQLKQHGMDALRLFNALYNKIHNIELYCTMKTGKNICNITIESKNGRVSQYKKFPKLSELHQVLFGFVPEKMHDAHVDTLACLNCYLKMQETTVA
jgi:DNA polymerase III epsilon subunit-like protein